MIDFVGGSAGDSFGFCSVAIYMIDIKYMKTGTI